MVSTWIKCDKYVSLLEIPHWLYVYSKAPPELDHKLKVCIISVNYIYSLWFEICMLWNFCYILLIILLFGDKNK